MQALIFKHSIPREAFGFTVGRLSKRAYTSALAPTMLRDVPEPTPPADSWVLCDSVQSGTCGSDTKQIFMHGAIDNPLTALLSFPHVLGHEVVAKRSDSGERVVLNPWLSCVPRGIDPICPACAEGRYPWCRNFDRGVISAALHLGNCASAPGTHAARVRARGRRVARFHARTARHRVDLGRALLTRNASGDSDRAAAALREAAEAAAAMGLPTIERMARELLAT